MSTVSNETANEEDVYFNFINSLKSDVTKKTYEREIKKFMEFSDVEKLSDLLSIIEPQKQIVKFLISQREKGLSFNSIRLNLHAIYHFYEMNDVPLNKKKINMFTGEFIRSVDRAYTHDEIKRGAHVISYRGST